ncbi:MobH family relaxase [Shewanella sp. MBTL60-007]|uniref:MobH family relaxase n=1 Tax=Shewanella sp. MBTL60-007 TaxID=2815911 RepID=UPI001BBF0230|nr:MobH family relaxase [Shewanella sp. MBTL60-007]GIU31306.1 hypothetical protein TUM3792_42930 [Shewanella sp. MBTL60-007]
MSHVNSNATVFLPVQSTEFLLAPYRSQIERLYHLCSLDRNRFETLYIKPIEIVASLCQAFPASENHHHSEDGGLFKHSLDAVEKSMKLREGVTCLAYGEERSQEVIEIFTYAVSMSALLHDLGKLACDIEIVERDRAGKVTSFEPLLSSTLTVGNEYAFRYALHRRHNVHVSYNVAFFTKVVPITGVRWLNNYRVIKDNLFQALSGRFEQAGEVGQVLMAADRFSVASNVETNQASNSAVSSKSNKPTKCQSFISKFRTLMDKETFKINCPGANVWVSDSRIYAVSGPVVSTVREHLKFDGIKLPTQLPQMYSMLLAENHIIPNEDKAIHNIVVTDEAGGNTWTQKLTMLVFDRSVVDPTRKLEVFAGSLVVADTGEVVDQIKTIERPEQAINVNQKNDDINRNNDDHHTNQTTSEEANKVEPSYEDFQKWLIAGFKDKKFEFNRPGAVFHIDCANRLVCITPRVFQEFMGSKEFGKIQSVVMKAKVLHRNGSGESLIKVKFSGDRASSAAVTCIIFSAIETKMIFNEVVPSTNHSLRIVDLLRSPKS